jgi:vacuolar protein sorting-associated protein 13A/C
MAAKLKLVLASKTSADSKDDGMGKKFLIKIIDNVQVTIKNIHVRYEDPGSARTTPYSMGITLQELAVNTTNPQWEKTFYDRNLKENKAKPIFKRLQLIGLALYMTFLSKKAIT